MMEVTTKGELAIVVGGAFEPFSGPMELADHLADLGITGKPGECELCPLSILLTAMMDGRTVRVYYDDAATDTDNDRVVCVDLPWVAASFITRFDAGEFSYLVERDPDDDEESDEDV